MIKRFIIYSFLIIITSLRINFFSEAEAAICYGIPNGATAPGSFDPNSPVSSGYELVFDSEFNDGNDFDLSCNSLGGTGNRGCKNPQGKNWYLDSWTQNITTPVSNLTIWNGVLTIKQTLSSGNWAFASAAGASATHGPASWQKGWNGTVFGGGWYAEARIAGTAIQGYAEGHPAFWSYAIEPLAGDAQWPNQPIGYLHFSEDDMLDGIYGSNFYVSNLIDWYGNPTVSKTAAELNPSTPYSGEMNVSSYRNLTTTTFLNYTFHIFGQLWVSATSTTQGFIQNYVDGQPTSKLAWPQYTNNITAPPSGQNVGSIIDNDHMMIILGVDPPQNPGDPAATLLVDWVHVWQLPSAAIASGNNAIIPQPNFTGGNGSCN